MISMFKNKWRKADRASRGRELQELEQQIPVQEYLAGSSHRTYSCIHCRAHLANHDELISKLFQGNHGRAYLFNKVVNIGCKQAVERELLTGLHAVADIYCDSCETTLGWKYERAYVPSQKYKEGKYIIELVHMLKENSWDLSSNNIRQLLQDQTPQPREPKRIRWLDQASSKFSKSDKKANRVESNNRNNETPTLTNATNKMNPSILIRTRAGSGSFMRSTPNNTSSGYRSSMDIRINMAANDNDNSRAS